MKEALEGQSLLPYGNHESTNVIPLIVKDHCLEGLAYARVTDYHCDYLVRVQPMMPQAYKDRRQLVKKQLYRTLQGIALDMTASTSRWITWEPKMG